MAALREEVLRAVLLRENSSLSELAAHLGREPPVVLHHLQSLVQEGLVERDESSTRPVYRALDFFSATWVNPLTKTVERWAISDRISWRFPLVSRLPDVRGRKTVHDFLSLADRRGIFVDPHLLTGEARNHRTSRKGFKPKEDREVARGIRVVVYGSVARGDVGPSSDIDVLVLLGPAAQDVEPILEDLVAEVNLGAPRRLDLVVVSPERKLSARFIAAVQRDGRVVFSSYERGFYEPIFPRSAP